MPSHSHVLRLPMLYDQNPQEMLAQSTSKTTTEMPKTTTEIPKTTAEMPKMTTELPETIIELPKTALRAKNDDQEIDQSPESSFLTNKSPNESESTGTSMTLREAKMILHFLQFKIDFLEMMAK